MALWEGRGVFWWTTRHLGMLAAFWRGWGLSVVGWEWEWGEGGGGHEVSTSGPFVKTFSWQNKSIQFLSP